MVSPLRFSPLSDSAGSELSIDIGPKMFVADQEREGMAIHMNGN